MSGISINAGQDFENLLRRMAIRKDPSITQTMDSDFDFDYQMYLVSQTNTMVAINFVSKFLVQPKESL